MAPTKIWKTPVECLAYLAAGICFFSLRFPLLPYWWTDFNSDFALVGVMAQDTLNGHFPIFYYGQNYMGGLEWLTAALAAKVSGASQVSMDILRANSLAWWFAASAAWVYFLRRISLLLAVSAAAFFAFGNYTLLWASCLQELSPQYVFFGALVSAAIWEKHSLLGRRGLCFGLLTGIAWWTNQSVVFFLLPALWIFQAEPNEWARNILVCEYFTRVRALRWLYWLAAIVILLGIGIALAGGINLPFGSGRIKIPNGISQVKAALLILAAAQLLAKLRAPNPTFKKQGREVFLKSRFLIVGFAIGYSPVWIGRILGLYEGGYGIGLAIIPVAEWPVQGRDLLRAIGKILFSTLVQRNLGGFTEITIAAGFAALVALGWWGRKRPLIRYGLFVLLLNITYVFISLRAQGAPTRYLYPAMIGAWLILLGMVSDRRLSGMRFPATLFFVAVAGISSWHSTHLLQNYFSEQDWRRDNIRGVMRAVESKGYKLCWGDYWTSYMLGYLSDEAVTYSPHPDSEDSQVRIKKYAEAIGAANPSCYVYRKSNDTLGQLYFSETNPWTKK